MTRLALLVAATFFMEFLDATILTTALPKMAQSLGSTPLDLSVGVSVYALTLAVFILPGGWAVERFGVRATLTAAIALFTLSSALCGVSTAPWFFVLARALQGVGGAFMVPVGRLIVLRTTPKSGILRATALLTWPGLTAPLIGPPLGGFLAESWSWRAIFYVNLPLGVVGAVLAWMWTPALERAEAKPFDLLGFALAGVAQGAALMALDATGWRAAALGLIAIATAAGFVWHVRRAAHPIADFRPFRHLSFRLGLTGGTAARVVISCVPFVLPLMFQLGMGFDATRAGLMVIPLFVGNIGIKPFTTPILRRWGFRRVLVLNAVAQALTLLGCAALGPGTPLALTAALLVVSGASRSMHFTALGTLPFADVPAEEMNVANLIYSVSFQASFAFGVAIATALMKLGALTTPAPLGPFRFTFAALGLIMLAVMLSHARLARNAGEAVTRRAQAGVRT
jgi:EmrB/QacA subfamily drug resistance transporter